MKNYLQSIINIALKKLGISERDVQLDTPKDEKHGDVTANIALLLAKELKQNPRVVAQSIIDNLELQPGHYF
jgi:arginyl-tRNA synthetase